MARQKDLTQKRLKELLHYDPATGLFTWAITRKKCKAGTRAGSYNDAGYRRITLDYNKYFEHQLVWLYVFGYIPKMLDHKNRDPGDNRLENLRECTRSQNAANSAKQHNSSLKYKGYWYRSDQEKYRVCVMKDGKKHYFGQYVTEEDAHAAYCKHARVLFGEFFHDGK